MPGQLAIAADHTVARAGINEFEFHELRLGVQEGLAARACRLGSNTAAIANSTQAIAA